MAVEQLILPPAEVHYPYNPPVSTLKQHSPLLPSVQMTSQTSPPTLDIARKHLLEDPATSASLNAQLDVRVKNARTLRLQNSYETESLLMTGGKSAKELFALKRQQYPVLPCFDCGKGCKCVDCDGDWLISALLDVTMVKESKDVGCYFTQDMLLEEGEMTEEGAAQEQMEALMSKVGYVQLKGTTQKQREALKNRLCGVYLSGHSIPALLPKYNKGEGNAGVQVHHDSEKKSCQVGTDVLGTGLVTPVFRASYATRGFRATVGFGRCRVS